MPDNGTEPFYVTREQLDAILKDYVRHETLDEIIAAQWQKLRRRLSRLLAAAMTACARAWLADNPAHLGEASGMLLMLSRDEEDVYVQSVETDTVMRLRENTPLH
jgi:hypothetical protein